MPGILLATLSSILLILTFPGFNIEFLAWIWFIPLFYAIDSKKQFQAFLLSYMAGVLFFAGTLYWLVHVTLLGAIILPFYLALFFGLFGILFYQIQLAAKRFSNISPIISLFLIPAAWVACEWLRSQLLTGFGWASLGYSQSFTLPVIQIADMTGVYGVSFFIVMVNTAIFLAAKDFKKRENLDVIIILALVIVFIVLGYGSYRLKNIFTGEKIKVGVVQGNIPQDKKWDAEFRETIMHKYESLTKELAREKNDLIVWPETSVPGFVESERDLFERVRQLAIDAKTPLLVGTLREDRRLKDLYYNSATLFMENGSIESTYDKIHLVPFGEYVPLKKVFSFVDKIAPAPIGDVSSGEKYNIFSFLLRRTSRDKEMTWRMTKKVRFSVLICFEDMFPEIAREFVKNGATFLVNITNDAWYKKTPAAWQHTEGSIFRAVENRVNVVRAANTGISCFIDQKGRIIDLVSVNGKDIFVDGFKSCEIVVMPTKTFYAKYGDIFAYLCIVSIIFILIVSKSYRK
jgi:apolipoprotein N-acyltransferase